MNSKHFNFNPTRKQLLIAGVTVAAGLTALSLGRSYFKGGVCKIHKDLTGKVIIITGSNSGIGKETARGLAKTNATIILACRDTQRTLPLIAELKTESQNQNIEFMKLDLSNLPSIRAFVEEFKSKYNHLDILINTAGVMALPERTLTKDGFEMQMGTNHIGHFYLTNLLLDVLKASGPSRIINVSSKAHENGKLNFDDLMQEKSYEPWGASSQSKIANIVFTRELQRRLDLENADVKVVSLHPGVVRTELVRHMEGPAYFIMMALWPLIVFMSKTAEQGAQTSLYCALEDHGKLKGGEYYYDCEVSKKLNPVVLEDGVGEKLWKATEQYLSRDN